MASDARLRKEVADLSKDFEVSGVKAEVVGGALTHLKGTIRGPADTPFAGGLYEVDIVIPRDYPFAGAICLDIIKKGPDSAWSPALTIKTALLSLQALLSAPEPNDPQDAEVAGQYKRSLKEWEGTAKYWNDMYARPSSGVADAVAGKVAELGRMGFEEAAARRALAIKGGNLEAAIEMLLATV